MDYAEARTVFLTPPATDRPAPDLPDTPGRRLRDAAEPIATISFWNRQTNERFVELGLDFLTGYVWARAATMGEPSAPVVAAAFAVFEPGFIGATYEQARATASRADVLRAREEGSVAALREVLSDADVGEAVGLLRRAVDAASAEIAGRPLFAGQVSLPWPDDPLGRLWYALTALRELRGDAHVAACVAAGLSGLQMNLLTEYWVGWVPTSYTATRAWSPEAMAAADADLVRRGLVADGRFTAGGRRLRDTIEEQTEAAMAAALEAIGPALPDLTRQLDEWSARIVAAGYAPHDPYKRISG